MNRLERTLESITPVDAEWRQKACDRLERLTMPHWALGRLMDLAADLAGMTRSMTPPVSPRTVVTMAGDHGVVAEGVSAYPQDVTAQMVRNFVNRGAGINALAAQSRTEVTVVDMGVAGDLSDLAAAGAIISRRIAAGTQNLAAGPAMAREQAVRCLEAGIELADQLSATYAVLGTGDMGIGNTTPSTAVVAAITGTPLAELTGRGTGINDRQLTHKTRVIEKALKVNQPDPGDAVDILAKVGGFEIGGIAGLILGSAAKRRPVVVDGFISTAGALLAHALKPQAADYMIMAHRSVEPGHAAMHRTLGSEPLLDLNLRLGEGTGAALAMNLLDAAVAVLTQVATFEEAAVSESDGPGHAEDDSVLF